MCCIFHSTVIVQYSYSCIVIVNGIINHHVKSRLNVLSIILCGILICTYLVYCKKKKKVKYNLCICINRKWNIKNYENKIMENSHLNMPQVPQVTRTIRFVFWSLDLCSSHLLHNSRLILIIGLSCHIYVYVLK